MVPRFYRSYAKLKTKTYLESLMQNVKAKDLGTGDIALHIAHAAEWTQADILTEYKEDFAKLINPRGLASVPDALEVDREDALELLKSKKNRKAAADRN